MPRITTAYITATVFKGFLFPSAAPSAAVTLLHAAERMCLNEPAQQEELALNSREVMHRITCRYPVAPATMTVWSSLPVENRERVRREARKSTVPLGKQALTKLRIVNKEELC